MDVFLGGCKKDGGHEDSWGVTMGRLMGVIDQSWIGIEETKKIEMVR